MKFRVNERVRQTTANNSPGVVKDGPFEVKNFGSPAYVVAFDSGRIALVGEVVLESEDWTDCPGEHRQSGEKWQRRS